MFKIEFSVSGVLILIGLLFIGGGVLSYLNTKDFLDRSVEAQGLVIALKGTGAKAPIVAYKDLMGRQAILNLAVFSNPPEFIVGEEVIVLYQPEEENHEASAQIKDFTQLWYLTLFLMGFGLFLLLFGLAAYYLPRLKTDGAEIPWFFIVIGVCLIIGGATDYAYTKSFVSGAVEVKGRVVALRGDKNGDGGLAPVVKYQDLQGRTATLYSTTKTKPSNFRVGEEVTVLYNPTQKYHEKTAKIKGFMNLWFTVLILLVLGFLFFIVGCFVRYVFIHAVEEHELEEEH